MPSFVTWATENDRNNDSTARSMGYFSLGSHIINVADSMVFLEIDGTIKKLWQQQWHNDIENAFHGEFFEWLF